MNKKHLKDVGERAAWTAAEVILGAISVEAMGLGQEWTPLVAAALAVLKGFVASKVGDPDSASTVNL